MTCGDRDAERPKAVTAGILSPPTELERVSLFFAVTSFLL